MHSSRVTQVASLFGSSAAVAGDACPSVLTAKTASEEHSDAPLQGGATPAAPIIPDQSTATVPEEGGVVHSTPKVPTSPTQPSPGGFPSFRGVSSRSLRVDALTSPCTPRVTRSRTRNARENDASASTEVSKLVERGLPAVDVTYPTHTTISSPDKTLVTQVACSSNQKVCGGGGGIPVAPAPEPILGSLSFHLCTSPLLSSAVSSAAGRCVRSPDLHLLAPAPCTYRSLPPTSAGAMEKDVKRQMETKISGGTSGGTGAKAGAGAAQPAVPALSGPPGPASVSHAGASSSSATLPPSPASR